MNALTLALILWAVAVYAGSLRWWIHDFEKKYGPDEETVIVGVFWALFPAAIFPLTTVMVLIVLVILHVRRSEGADHA